MKIAIVHDQLAEFGGAERVLISLKQMYPAADVFVSFVDVKRLGIHLSKFKDWKIIQSRAQYIPFFTRLYSPLRFLLPWVWRSFNLSSYDLVICSSSWGMSKGVSLQKLKLQKNIPTYVCYLHTPPRYLYGYDESSLKKYFVVRLYAQIVNHFLRMYDFESSQTIDQFIFNSEEIRKRSLAFYRKDGIVIHPPISTTVSEHQSNSNIPNPKDSYFLTISRLAPTKHIDILIHACNKLGAPLIIVGTGNQIEHLQSIAGPTITFKGHVPDSEFAELYRGARAFLYASVNEDFGMVPVEAMSFGVPVIAYASGGVKETVTHLERGVQYKELTPDAICKAIAEYDNLSESEKQRILENGRAFALTCSEGEFTSKIRAYIASLTKMHDHT
ncbi:MAG: glycosyltransferase [Candidatus Roizmanbacteria bacterium]